MARMDADGDPIFQTDSDSTSFSDFVDEDAVLWKRVDFLGIIATIGKSWILALFTFLTGIWLSLSKAIDDVGSAVIGFYESIVGAFNDGIATIQSAAVAESASHVVDFGLFSMPAGMVVAVVAVGSATVIIYFFIWGDA